MYESMTLYCYGRGVVSRDEWVQGPAIEPPYSNLKLKIKFYIFNSKL